jgi:hypothetical protein
MFGRPNACADPQQAAYNTSHHAPQEGVADDIKDQIRTVLLPFGVIDMAHRIIALRGPAKTGKVMLAQQQLRALLQATQVEWLSHEMSIMAIQR